MTLKLRFTVTNFKTKWIGAYISLLDKGEWINNKGGNNLFLFEHSEDG